MIKRYLNLPCLILFFLTISVRAQNKRQYVQELSPILVTARGGFEELQFSSAWSAESIDDANKLKLSRSMPEALSGIPSVMIQKTALGQTSPYIRGLTGYHNLLLVDSIRLNHSAMRSGPNQYWSTVETQGSERIEVIRGPNGIIHGADESVAWLMFYLPTRLFQKVELAKEDIFGGDYPLQNILGRLDLRERFQTRSGSPNSPMWSDPLETWKGGSLWVNKGILAMIPAGRILGFTEN